MVVSATALKVETPLAETPRPVSVVDQEELEERNVQQLDETFRYRAGVLAGMYGSDNNTDWFKVRGFDQSTYQDGLRLYREGYYQWLPEPYGLERVEVFKGPSSILYGEAPPGGLINAISKRPTDEPFGQIQVQAGNRDHRQVGVDVSAPLSEDVRYRIVTVYKERDGDLNDTHNDRYYIAPSLEWDISDDTQLTVLASLQKDDGVPTNAFKLPYGTVDDTPFGHVDPQTNYGEPGYDRDQRTQAAIGYEFSHAFNDTWSFEQDFRYSDLDLDLRSTYITTYPPVTSGRTGPRGHLQRNGEIESYTVDNRVIGKWYTDRTENTLLIGVDYQDLSLEGKEFDDFAYDTIDLFNPQHGNYTPITDDQMTDRAIDKNQTGIYVQDQFRLDDHWVFLGGVRYDMADTDNVNETTGVKERADDNQVSWSGGVMYLSDIGLNPYLSYTESFEPITAVDDGGSLYEPREGKQWELGVKYAPVGWDGYVTLALYDIEESNTLVTSPQGIQVQEGERQSQGVEIESVGYLTDNLRLTAAYTYADAELENGDRAPLIPRHMASTWLDYAFTGGLHGLKVGAGLRYVGETVDGDTTVDDYTVGDVMASYDINRHWRAQVNVSNVTDEEYVASCDYWCYYGESRSVIGSLTYNF
ncbi:ligand-gated channel [Halomonas huangheensis]|nr:ligand-gated channel [Halomonas huangheensis]